MKTSLGRSVASLALAAVAVAFWMGNAAATDNDASRVAPPGSHAYGKTLTEWLTTYLRWGFSGADPAHSMVGHVAMLPIPVGDHVSGAGTPGDPALYRGQLAVTLRPATPFVLPLATWAVERYNNGQADDPAISDAEFLAGVRPSLYIDGREVVSGSNAANYYVPLTVFDPIVIYPAPTDYHSYAAVAFQGYGIVSPPLSVGKHVIHLYEPYVIPSFSIGVIYDNTWIVTVSPH